MKRIVSLCFLILAAVLGFLHLESLPAWAPFQLPEVISQDHGQDDQIDIGAAHQLQANLDPRAGWLPDTGAASVHAASMIALKNGNVRAFWFAGTREGAADVVINSAVFDIRSEQWSNPVVVIDRLQMEKNLWRYISKLGNPLPVRGADGQLQLFFVTVSIGGWAGSSISAMSSDDEGVTWINPRRLITSPLLNLSALVKSPALQFSDGRMGIPAYHELIGKFGELLRIDEGRVIDKRRMSDGRSSIQPLVFVESHQNGVAYFRQARLLGPAKIAVSETKDSGQSWIVEGDLPIPNPNSALAGLILKNGSRILVANNLEQGRDRLVMLMASDSSKDWKVIQVLEDDEGLPDEQRREFSYPFLSATSDGRVHLLYTWDRKRIRHVYFQSTWFDNAKANLKETANESN